MKLRFKAHVTKGKPFLEDRDLFYENLVQYEDKDIEIIVGKWQEKKTLQQIRYFHGPLLECASEFTGDTKDSIKAFLKDKFLKEYRTTKGGSEYCFIPSLEKIKKEAMSKFIDQCVTFLAQHGCSVPDIELTA